MTRVGITVYGRRAIRRIERATGERVVHAVETAGGTMATTVGHRHLAEALGWAAVCWRTPTDCGANLWSCRALFGADGTGARVHFMRGACPDCRVGPGELHRAVCPALADLLAAPTINPDYWPRPVHRPLWRDDPRRRLVVQA